MSIACLTRAFALIFGRIRAIDDGERHGSIGCDELHRLIANQIEVRAQHVVSPPNFVERPLQCRDVQRPCQAQNLNHVVRGIIRAKLIEEPESLLAKGQWRRSALGSSAESPRTGRIGCAGSFGKFDIGRVVTSDHQKPGCGA